MNSRKSLILLLSATALVQMAVLTFYYTSQPAGAQDFKSSRTGLFLATTALEKSDNDLLWMINLTTHQIGVYKAFRSGQIVNLANADLTEIFVRDADVSVRPAPTTISKPPQNPPAQKPATP